MRIISESVNKTMCLPSCGTYGVITSCTTTFATLTSFNKRTITSHLESNQITFTFTFTIFFSMYANFYLVLEAKIVKNNIHTTTCCTLGKQLQIINEVFP